MLRYRTRAVTNNSKQALMTDHHKSKSPPNLNNNNQSNSSFISSNFTGFNFKAFSGKIDPLLMSPTSILDNKTFSPFHNTSRFESNQPRSPKPAPETKRSWDNLDSKGITIALIDKNEDSTKILPPRPNNRMVLANLRVQIPPLTIESDKSPTDFGTKDNFTSTLQSKESPKTPMTFNRCLSITEMELSEDYTCVISHGPNPKTTHIFENCVVENYCCVSDMAASDSIHDPRNFLSFCYTCKKNLGERHDIYIYRGEKAFCSEECRYQEMLIDEIEN